MSSNYYFEKYKGWVRRNGNVLSLLETTGSSLTWLLPERFSEQELTLESIHTIINVVSVLHDSIINEDPQASDPENASRLSFALSALQQCEVLFELAALWAERHRLLASKYDVLSAVEAAK